ncbi:hypothetical protein DICA2_E29470 [Diutina catenulata]
MTPTSSYPDGRRLQVAVKPGVMRDKYHMDDVDEFFRDDTTVDEQQPPYRGANRYTRALVQSTPAPAPSVPVRSPEFDDDNEDPPYLRHLREAHPNTGTPTAKPSYPGRVRELERMYGPKNDDNSTPQGQRSSKSPQEPPKNQPPQPSSSQRQPTSPRVTSLEAPANHATKVTPHSGHSGSFGSTHSSNYDPNHFSNIARKINFDHQGKDFTMSPILSSHLRKDMNSPLRSPMPMGQLQVDPLNPLPHEPRGPSNLHPTTQGQPAVPTSHTRPQLYTQREQHGETTHVAGHHPSLSWRPGGEITPQVTPAASRLGSAIHLPPDMVAPTPPRDNLNEPSRGAPQFSVGVPGSPSWQPSRSESRSPIFPPGAKPGFRFSNAQRSQTEGTVDRPDVTSAPLPSGPMGPPPRPGGAHNQYHHATPTERHPDNTTRESYPTSIPAHHPDVVQRLSSPSRITPQPSFPDAQSEGFSVTNHSTPKAFTNDAMRLQAPAAKRPRMASADGKSHDAIIIDSDSDEDASAERKQRPVQRRLEEMQGVTRSREQPRIESQKGSVSKAEEASKTTETKALAAPMRAIKAAPDSKTRPVPSSSPMPSDSFAMDASFDETYHNIHAPEPQASSDPRLAWKSAPTPFLMKERSNGNSSRDPSPHPDSDKAPPPIKLAFSGPAQGVSRKLDDDVTSTVYWDDRPDVSASGVMTVSGIKPPRNSGSAHYYFHVVSGAIEVTVCDTIFVADTGCSFRIPPRSVYGLKSISTASLFFVQVKDPTRPAPMPPMNEMGSPVKRLNPVISSKTSSSPTRPQH